MKKVRLGDICTIVSGTTPKSNVEEYWGGHNIWITPAELSANSFIINDSERHITDLAVSKSGLKSFPKGTVILSSRAPIGKTAIAGCEMYCNQGFKNLICSDEINNVYLYYFLKSKTQYLNSLGRGATFKEISKGLVENIEIPLPRIEQQVKIGNTLRAIEELLEKRNSQLSLFDELIKSRFVEMFGNTNTDSTSLCDVADIVSGITKGRKLVNTKLYEVPYMAVSNVKSGYIDWNTVKTIGASKAEIVQYRLKPNDILMTEGGDPDKVGRGAIIKDPPKDCIHQNHIFRVRLNQNKVAPEYFEEYLQSTIARKYFLRAAKQTTGIASINMKQLKNLPVKIPPITFQNQFTAFVQQVDKSRLAGKKSSRMIQNMVKYRVECNFFIMRSAGIWGTSIIYCRNQNS